MLKRLRKLFFGYIPTVIKTDILKRHPNLYRFFEIQPSSCTVFITNKCNLRCVMCRQWRDSFPPGELDADKWKKIFSDLKRNGIRNIHFTGGEPLLRKDLTELVAYCAKNGFTVGLTTNAVLLNGEKLEELISSGLRSIAVSLDALEAEYDDIRGMQGAFKKVESSLRMIAEKKRERALDAYVNFTLMKNNMDQLPAVKNFTDKIGIPLALCLLDSSSFIFDLEDNKNKLWISEDKDFRALGRVKEFLRAEKARDAGSLLTNFPAIDFMENYFRDPVQEKILCVSSQDRIIIDAYGELLGGCMAMGTFGNLSKEPFRELRKAQKYGRAKKNMLYKVCKGCSCGYVFNIRCMPSLIMKDVFMRAKFMSNKR